MSSQAGGLQKLGCCPARCTEAVRAVLVYQLDWCGDVARKGRQTGGAITSVLLRLFQCETQKASCTAGLSHWPALPLHVLARNTAGRHSYRNETHPDHTARPAAGGTGGCTHPLWSGPQMQSSQYGTLPNTTRFAPVWLRLTQGLCNARRTVVRTTVVKVRACVAPQMPFSPNCSAIRMRPREPDHTVPDRTVHIPDTK